MFRRGDNTLCGRNVATEADGRVLDDQHLIPVVGQGVEHGLPAGAVDERAMHQDD